jgi:hypothetical protein
LKIATGCVQANAFRGFRNHTAADLKRVTLEPKMPRDEGAGVFTESFTENFADDSANTSPSAYWISYAPRYAPLSAASGEAEKRLLGGGGRFK